VAPPALARAARLAARARPRTARLQSVRVTPTHPMTPCRSPAGSPSVTRRASPRAREGA
jgi:hypothetical protein